VLRLVAGDDIMLMDGQGTFYEAEVTATDKRHCHYSILHELPQERLWTPWLHIAVAPTKNIDRMEWFVEKATEVGVDRIVPVIGERSERKVYKTDRAYRIALSATKQSLKARIPEIAEPLSVKDFIQISPLASLNRNDSTPCHSGPAEQVKEPLKLIAYCFEGDTRRISIQEAIATSTATDITILIGPEGDFSPEEARLAIEHGYIPVHLGASRLRTETAAVVAATAVYLARG
jgi:16S rRNA (uracil1498-N3)-methyltransferase